MIVEYIRYTIPADRAADFEERYGRAQASLAASPHCRAWELTRCVEEPEHYILRIEWDSMEGHMQGFRKSAEFRPFLAEVRPLISDIQEMRHYALTAVQGANR